ncbi:hypothetical protein VNO77_15892 [Canavalia gladiata]|uniref:Uncharacterized protein n=1 Tax=Canavalia gladiata TaxID=3824 RepID=A0AAN9QSL4_CANGL
MLNTYEVWLMLTTKGTVSDLKKCTTEDKPGTPHATEESGFAPVEIADSLQGHNVEKVIDKHNSFSFNPLAPEFFPGIGFKKGDLDPATLVRL